MRSELGAWAAPEANLDFAIVRKSDLPSIYDAVTIGDLSSAFLSPEQIAAARSGTGDRISFSFVQAPRPMHDGELSQQIAAVRPEHYAEVERPSEVKVRYLDREGKEQEVHATGLLSVCLQHEIEHLDGTSYPYFNVDEVRAAMQVKDYVVKQLQEREAAGTATPALPKLRPIAVPE